MNLLTAIELIILAVLLSIAAGALTGVKIGGEFLGKELAAMMGGFYGPVAAVPAVLLGIILLVYLK
jgi:uncharacterized membrane protein